MDDMRHVFAYEHGKSQHRIKEPSDTLRQSKNIQGFFSGSQLYGLLYALVLPRL